MIRSNENNTHLVGLVTTSEFFYQLYINSSKTKSKARILKAINHEISQYIINEFHKYPEESREDLGRLLEHVLSFVYQWEEYDGLHETSESDVFAYETTLPFPRDSVQRLIAQISQP